MEILIPQIKGIYRDCLYGADGRLLYDSGWRDNKIVNSCHILLAHLMKGGGNNPSKQTGIAFLQVGSGDQSWDASIPAVDDQTAALTTPYVEKYSLDLIYLQPGSNPPIQSEQPTRCIQASVTLAPNSPSVADGQLALLREFGLFGRAGNTEYMIDCVRHPLIQKDSTMTLTRVIRLTF